MASTCKSKTLEELLEIKGTLYCENPNSNLTKFQGLLKLENKDSFPVSISQILLRVNLFFFKKNNNLNLGNCFKKYRMGFWSCYLYWKRNKINDEFR